MVAIPAIAIAIMLTAFGIYSAQAEEGTTVTRYEQTDGKILYLGTWATFKTTGASSGSYKYSDSKATALISFSGTQLDLIVTMGYTMGTARIIVDGAAPTYVSLYSPTTMRQQKVWSTGRLTSGTHQVAISWAGQASVAGGGTRVNIDALDISGTLTQASLALMEQTDPGIAYQGAWSVNSSSSASGGAFNSGSARGSSASITFTGTEVRYVATTGPSFGLAKLTLDGGSPVYVDLYSSSLRYKRILWSSFDLDAGRHVLTVDWTGQKNARAKGASVNLDAVMVAPIPTSSVSFPAGVTTTTATAPPTTTSTTAGSTTQTAVVPEGRGTALTRYEQTDSHLQYTGSWPTYYTSKASSGGYMRANTSGSSVTVTFNGTYLAWVATRGTTLGKALVSLDGGPATTINLAASSVAYQQTVWNTGTLSSQSHTVKIWRDPSNVSGKYISVDALDVAGTLTSGSTTSTTTAAPTTTTTAAAPATTTSSSNGRVYYVDATLGSDANDGTSTSRPWKSLAKVHNTTFQPGDTILFKRGEIWRDNNLYIDKGAGTAGAPITFGAYGTGAKPEINGGVDLSSNAAWTQYNGNTWRTANPITQPQHDYMNEIGNVLFNNGQSIGAQKTSVGGCSKQGDYFYDQATRYLYLYSGVTPPATTARSRQLAGSWDCV